MPELLMGDEAVGLAAIHARIGGAFSYPGTPATEIFEFIEKHAQQNGSISTRWSTNEKVAYEEALGMSYVGRRALVSMKHVGLNVAADPFMSSALTGANGGLVVAVADDPGMHSSQNEQDTRFYAEFARVPLFEPSNQQEAYDATREAFELSERFGIPVLIRLVTRLAHSRAVVTPSPPAEVRNGKDRGKSAHWILLPVNARRRNRKLIEFQPQLLEYTSRCPFNLLTLAGPKGIIACGLGNNYVQEVLGRKTDRSMLKIAAYPIPTELVRRIVDHCDEVLLVEEGYPLVESKLRGLLGVPGKMIRGRMDGALPADGELSADTLRAAFNLEPLGDPAMVGLPARPPALCTGCPHCDTFQMINEAVGNGVQPYLFSDIGCYTLGAMPPYNGVHTCVDMGASISMGHGAAQAGAHPVICTIGDSTFTHSGMTALLGAAKYNANMTVMILDNATVAMTGGQDVFVTGEEFIRLLRGLGVAAHHIVHVEPVRKDHARNVQLLRNEINYPGLSVFIASRPCIHTKRRVSNEKTQEKPEAQPAATGVLD
jgi:indolepyruvate ferredoxin oxidoreductase alpha subunit